MEKLSYSYLSRETHLKNKTEINSSWEGAIYQSEWAKINSSWVVFNFFLYVCCCLMHPNCFVWPIQQILNAFYIILIFHFKYQILYTCKLASLSLRNQHICEKVRFLSEMSKISLRWVIFQSLRVNTFYECIIFLNCELITKCIKI